MVPWRPRRQFLPAIDYGQDQLADCERNLGDTHPDTLASRNNLADAYQEAGRLRRASGP